MRYRHHNPVWEHIKRFVWVILIFEFLLFCLALVVGKNTDFGFAFNVCLWLTVVHYKHWTGPVYFNVIRPFHHLVVRQMARAGTKANQEKA